NPVFRPISTAGFRVTDGDACSAVRAWVDDHEIRDPCCSERSDRSLEPSLKKYARLDRAAPKLDDRLVHRSLSEIDERPSAFSQLFGDRALVELALLGEKRCERLLGHAKLTKERCRFLRVKPVPEVALARVEPHVLRKGRRG